MTTTKFYLIQGIIFQTGYRFDLGFKSDQQSLPEIDFTTTNAMYNGIVKRYNPNSELFHGEMKDIWGNSKITDFEVNKHELKFVKTYEKRPPIVYLFTRKENDMWIGTFEGDDCGIGITKCIISEINDSFFVSK